MPPWQHGNMHTPMNAESWLQEHGDYLFKFAISRIRDEEIAVDLVQETLLAAWKGQHGFKNQSSLRTWLVGILKHKITDHIRREIRRRELSHAVENDPTSAFFNAGGHWQEPPDQWRSNPESLLGNDEFHATLQQCMDELPPRQQQVFHLREIVGEDTDFICNALDITPTHLHVLIHRARLALRRCLECNWFGRT